MSPRERIDPSLNPHEMCAELEAAAGLTQAMERAREGRFIPLGAFGEKVSSEEYFADQYDYFRKSARAAYFSVQDIELRKRLIAARRRADEDTRQSFDSDVAAASRAVLAAKTNARNQPWGKAAMLAVATVAAGYWFWDLVGALAGAVGGFFLGNGTLAQAKNEATAQLEQAMQELEQARKEQAQRSLWPECFSRSEETTGERDLSMDQGSAYANVLGAERSSFSGPIYP